MRRFLSGNEAVAEGVRLAKPDVISAYPITPQTTIVEKLSEIVEQKKLDSRFVHVESEHSALSCAIGASAIGARTFTATSSQGLLYMAECLPYAAGGKFPIVMVNANRSTALPWNIFGDQRDSLSQLDCGWIQVYVEDAQEALDTVIESYFIAEHEKVSSPVMINLDGFELTHTYESVEIPEQQDVDEFLPKFQTQNKFDFKNPKNLGFSVGPADNLEWKIREHQSIVNSLEVIEQSRNKFKQIFNRDYGGAIDSYKVDDADYVLISIGSISGLVRNVVAELRTRGEKVGYLKIRYIRPFPAENIRQALQNAKKIGVLEKDISFGHFGTVYTNIKSVVDTQSKNFVAGLGGRNITRQNIFEIFEKIKSDGDELNFIGAKFNE